MPRLAFATEGKLGATGLPVLFSIRTCCFRLICRYHFIDVARFISSLVIFVEFDSLRAVIGFSSWSVALELAKNVEES